MVARQTDKVATTTRSALAWSSHQFECCFDTSPGLGFLRLAFLLVAVSLLSCLYNRPTAVGFIKLSGIFTDFDLFHPHDSFPVFIKSRVAPAVIPIAPQCSSELRHS
jgi:hypothetical protein